MYFQSDFTRAYSLGQVCALAVQYCKLSSRLLLVKRRLFNWRRKLTLAAPVCYHIVKFFIVMRNTEGFKMVSAKPGLPDVFSKGCEVVVMFYGTVEKQNDDDAYDIKIENEAVVGNVRGTTMRAVDVNAAEVKCVAPPDMVTIFIESKKVR